MNSPQRVGVLRTPVDFQLFPRRAVMIYDPPNGADVVFSCHDHEGHFFYCKADKPGRRIRAVEMICTTLADRLGIRTAEFAVIEHGGETYFGSRQEMSSAGHFEVQDFLTTPMQNELGQPAAFPGEYLAQMLALDLFFGNPDRAIHNFLLVRDGGILRICAIDFASVDLSVLTTSSFPVANCPTLTVGKRFGKIHGTFVGASVEMIARIEALPADVFARIVAGVPEDWLSEEERGGLVGIWDSPGFRSRLMSLRAGLVDGTLV